MKVAIMQPTYLPWAGYFNMMSSVDIFVFLDDVQFAKRSWQQRNRILLKGKEHFLTVPVLSMGKRCQRICDVITDESQLWRKKHKQTIYHAYSSHPHGKIVTDLINRCLNAQSSSLAEINVLIIEAIAFLLEINTKTMFSSQLPVSGKKSQYLFNICNYLGADIYLSAEGSKTYIEDEGVFDSSGIDVEYHKFIPEPYPQVYSYQFIPYLSIIDVIANLGIPQTKEYIFL